MAASGGLWAKGRFVPAGRRERRPADSATSERLKGDVVEFGKEEQVGAVLNGVPLRPVSPGFWKGEPEVVLDEPAWPKGNKGHSAGVVMIEPDGRIWVYEPTHHYGGYRHTFPKGHVESGASDQQTALREAYEETGLRARITGVVGIFEGDTTVTKYYLARRIAGVPWAHGWEAQKVKLATPARLRTMLNRQRDRDVLAAALAKV